jgi:hypothetical protein
VQVRGKLLRSTIEATHVLHHFCVFVSHSHLCVSGLTHNVCTPLPPFSSQVEDVLEAMGYSLSRMPPETQLPRFAAFIAPIVGAITTFLSESAETPVRQGVPFPGEETLAT